MQFNKTIDINNFILSNNSRTFIIAEARVNHGGDMSIAKALIDVASDSSADVVKFQTFKAEEPLLESFEKVLYQKEISDVNKTQFDIITHIEISKQQNPEQKNIIFLMTSLEPELRMFIINAVNYFEKEKNMYIE